MGTYHLMGLGLSPGAITGPVSYLAHRYQRWNADDQRFFARSGEARQREAGEKVGDIQALVLFTTCEVLNGDPEGLPNKYVDNPPGRIPPGAAEVRGRLDKPMKEVLCTLLRREWPGISGGRPGGTIFWCEVDRRDIRITYERVIQVLAALAGVGGQGKEMWINLTGGNNVINFALELAATLSGNVARLYYVQAENPEAEKCVRYTAEDGYWVDLPVMGLTLSRVSCAVLDLLNQRSELSAKEIHSRLRNHREYWTLIQDVDFETFQNLYLRPMWKQGLIAEVSGGYIIGSQWELIRPYHERLLLARQDALTIEQLARKEPWIEVEMLSMR